MQIFDSRPWESLTGWRKPILFGISTGATLVSLAWVAGFVRAKRANLIAWTISVLACLEVPIIAVQTWRGVPAHFNTGALVDRLLTNSVDLMLIAITLGIFNLTWQTLKFKGDQTKADYLLAARAGMLYLSLACLLGFAAAIYGNAMLGAEADPGLVKPRGVPKFAHGMPLHAIQILPLWALALKFFAVTVEQRQKSVWFLSLSILAATLYAAWQTVNGWARFESNAIGWLLLSGVVVSVFGAIVCAAVSGKRKKVLSAT